MADDLDPAAVERAARAFYDHDRGTRRWEGLPDFVRQDYLDKMRAALAAARSCTCQGPSPCSDGPDVDCPRHGDGLAAARGGAVPAERMRPGESVADVLNRWATGPAIAQMVVAEVRAALAAARAGEVEPRATLLRLADEVQHAEWPGCGGEARVVAEAVADMLRDEAAQRGREAEPCTCTRAFASSSIAVVHHDCPVHGATAQRGGEAVGREAAWGAFRDGPDYPPTDRYDVRAVWDAAWAAARGDAPVRPVSADALLLAAERAGVEVDMLRPVLADLRIEVREP